MERKRRGRGRAGILSQAQFDAILQQSPPKYKLLWAICFYTKCRISQALQLTRSDITSDRITFTMETFRKTKTREVEIPAKLAEIINEYDLPAVGLLFPGEKGHLSRQVADLQLRELCRYLGFKGISTNSFIRTSKAKMNSWNALDAVGEVL